MSEQKLAIAKRILENSVYLPESGLRKSLTESLAKLPLKQLHNLSVIIDIKCQDAKKS
jgi:hypothetical protein